MFDGLDDACAMRLIPCDPALGDPAWSSLRESLAKLFAQFEREGRVSTWGCELLAGGSIVAMAWKGADTLSGCSHDKIARLLLAVEERHGLRLINAPPLVVEIAGRCRCLDRVALKALAAEGLLSATDTWVHDLAPADLGAWRARPRQRLGASRFATLVPAQPKPAS